ncbi:MAG: cation transporting ATPase C-terminal domain-containing protein [Acidimicrobiales bacterium]
MAVKVITGDNGVVAAKVCRDIDVDVKGVLSGVEVEALDDDALATAILVQQYDIGSAAGASLFLSFLPMLPSQILLNNLLYDVGQLAIPTDRVDAEVLARPAVWVIAFVRRFMSVFGPVSSIFDLMTFFVMLAILHAGHSEFRSGWFVESLATRTLVVFLIRTRRVPFFRSRPSLAMMITPPTCALVGAVRPFPEASRPLRMSGTGARSTDAPPGSSITPPRTPTPCHEVRKAPDAGGVRGDSRAVARPTRQGGSSGRLPRGAHRVGRQRVRRRPVGELGPHLVLGDGDHVTVLVEHVTGGVGHGRAPLGL